MLARDACICDAYTHMYTLVVHACHARVHPIYVQYIVHDLLKSTPTLSHTQTHGCSCVFATHICSLARACTHTHICRHIHICVLAAHDFLPWLFLNKAVSRCTRFNFPCARTTVRGFGRSSTISQDSGALLFSQQCTRTRRNTCHAVMEWI